MTSYTTRVVQFNVDGVQIVGRLFESSQPGRLPAVTIMGPILSIKEQSPFQYASRLAQRGFVALAFDARNHGESGGEPRHHESIKMKIEDVKGSIDFLVTLPNVDVEKIMLLGICQGVNTVLGVAEIDTRAKSVALVTGNYITRENVKRIFGGDEGLDRQIAMGDEALAKFKSTGVADMGTICQTEENGKRTDVLLGHPAVWLYYHQWWPHTRWVNTYTLMSNAEIWRVDVLETAKKVTNPVIMVHSDFSDGGGPGGKLTFEALASKTKKKYWMTANHTEFYENPYVIDEAVEQINAFFKEN